MVGKNRARAVPTINAAADDFAHPTILTAAAVRHMKKIP
jgi:hypothetical protein